MKTVKIDINNKENEIIFACGSCFNIIDLIDVFCWNCGGYFDTEYEHISNFIELEEIMNKLNPEGK